MAPVIAQLSPASQEEGQLLKHPLKSLEAARSADSFTFGLTCPRVEQLIRQLFNELSSSPV